MGDRCMHVISPAHVIDIGMAYIQAYNEFRRLAVKEPRWFPDKSQRCRELYATQDDWFKRLDAVCDVLCIDANDVIGMARVALRWYERTKWQKLPHCEDRLLEVMCPIRIP